MTDTAIPGERSESLTRRLRSIAASSAALGATGSLPEAPGYSPPTQPVFIESAARIARAARDRRDRDDRFIDRAAMACAGFVYSLGAFAGRIAVGSATFLAGQSLIDGPRLPLTLRGFDLSFVLPSSVKAETISQFIGTLPATPIPPALVASVVGYAEFVLPICLVLGLLTRFAAFGLVLVAALVALVLPSGALSPTQVYWASILLMVLALGPGAFSLDRGIRALRA